MENHSPKNLRLKNLFATHPKVDRFYLTSDETPFIAQHHAEAHAKTLDDKSVQPYSRAIFEKVESLKADLTINTNGKTLDEVAGTLTGSLASLVEPGTITDPPAEIKPKPEVSPLEAAQAEFEALTGKSAGNRKLETLLAQIAEAKAAKEEVTTKQ